VKPAQRWARAKLAGWDSEFDRNPVTSRSQGATDFTAQQMLNSHFPYREGHRTIMEATNLSTMDRVNLLSSLRQGASRDTGVPQSSVRLGDFLPVAAGAGLGLLGSAMIAPLFSLSPTQKKYFGIGSAALGAVLNTVGRR
jgi:hypothetical protein